MLEIFIDARQTKRTQEQMMTSGTLIEEGNKQEHQIKAAMHDTKPQNNDIGATLHAWIDEDSITNLVKYLKREKEI